MGRPRLLLPLLTTALPFVAGAAPWFHGALAGLLAIVSPLLVDLVTSRSGGTTWRAGDDEAPAPARYYAVLFHLYAGGFLFFFARFVLTSPSLSPEDVIGRAFSWVVLAGVPTLIVGHALIHQRAKTARVIGQSLFSLLNYPDFPRLHVEMHHRHVATDPDHHSAPKDQTFYRFFVHSLVGELTSIPRAGQRMRSALLLALQAALLVAITGFAGPRALLVFLVTTFLARGVVALVNYVQHYGLERAPRTEGWRRARLGPALQIRQLALLQRGLSRRSSHQGEHRCRGARAPQHDVHAASQHPDHPAARAPAAALLPDDESAARRRSAAAAVGIAREAGTALAVERAEGVEILAAAAAAGGAGAPASRWFRSSRSSRCARSSPCRCCTYPTWSRAACSSRCRSSTTSPDRRRPPRRCCRQDRRRRRR